MNTITLNLSGIKITETTKTVVTKVNNPEGESSIVVDSMRGIEISLGGKSAKDLGIEKNSQVTLSPIDGSTDGSFTLSVGEKAKPKSAVPETRGNSPMPDFMMSNTLS